MARADFDHFSRVPEGSAEGHHSGAFADSVLPVIEAGQADLVGPEQIASCDLADGLSLEEAPGHTPGSVLVRIENTFGRAVVSGDVIHHPIQILEPTLHVEGEHDTAQATRTRQRLLERWADSGALLLPAHFPAPTAGRIARAMGGFRFDCEAA
jgi:glyoxylase-like metal-dependent hydrolase (beta-lactamase superfamily II)